MEKILEKLSQIDNEIKTSEATFVCEREEISNKYKDNLNLLAEIKKEVLSIISDLSLKIRPLERRIEILDAEIGEKEVINKNLITALDEKKAAIDTEVAEKQASIIEMEDKLSKLQKIISSYVSEKEAITDALSKSRVALDMAENGAIKAKEEELEFKKQLEIANKELGAISSEKDILNADIRIKREQVEELNQSIEKLKTAKSILLKKD